MLTLLQAIQNVQDTFLYYMSNNQTKPIWNFISHLFSSVLKSKILWEFPWQYCQGVSWIYFKTTISIVVFYCMKFICFQNFGNNRETKSHKQSFPQIYNSSSPHPLRPLHPNLMKVVIIITLKYNKDCSQSDFRSPMIGNIYSSHNISQVSATLGPQALSALISKLSAAAKILNFISALLKTKKRKLSYSKAILFYWTLCFRGKR